MITASRIISKCLLAAFGIAAFAGGGTAIAQAPIDPPALVAPNRYATSLQGLRDIIHGTNGVTKISPGQCVQLNDGNYLNDNTTGTLGTVAIANVSFNPPITVRSTSRRYKGYGPNGGLTTGGAVIKLLTLNTVSGITFDGLAIHRGSTGGYPLEPGVQIRTVSNTTFRGMEFFGFKPTGTEENWRTMGYNDTYNQQWSNQPQAIRRISGTCDKITVEYCLTRFTGQVGINLEFVPNCIVRRNAFTYTMSDFIKFEGMSGSVFEDNIFFRPFPVTGSNGDIAHADGMQSTSKANNSPINVTIKRNLIFDCIGRKLQGIFAEQDGAAPIMGPSGFVVEDNFVFMPSATTGFAISVGQSNGNNKVRYNTAIADVHRGSANPNIFHGIGKRSAESPSGDEGKYNVSDNFSFHALVTTAGNVNLNEVDYTASHLYNYSSDPAKKIDGLLSATAGEGTFIFQPAVLQKLAWKVGSTKYDPNYNGGAGAWRAFVSYGAVPPGWTYGGGGGGGTQPPAPWVSADIGSPAAGSSSYSSGTFTIVGGGTDISSTSDKFRYVYQPVTGDVEIKARVDSLTNSSSWAKAGVMIRDGTGTGAMFAMANATPTTSMEFKYRTTTNGTAAGVAPVGASPKWVRLTRVGNVFTGYRSTDGVTWTSMGSATIAMPANTLIGLPVCAQHATSTTTAVISNVSIIGGTSANGNLALNKVATASSQESTSRTPAMAVDGNLTTRWASVLAPTTAQWIQVDLGSNQTVGKVVLKWEAAYATQYTIQTSTDGTTWTTRSTVTAGDGGTDTLSFTPVSVRYVRANCTARINSSWGYSLWEFEVYAN